MSDDQGHTTNAFPSSPTVLVAIWLFAYTIISGVALYSAFANGFIVKYDELPEINSPFFYKESFIAIYAAGIGSVITTLLGFLDHASIRKDFDTAFVPWYFIRPVIGIALGLVFYFVLRGGFLVLDAGTGIGDTEPFSPWAIAAISALVGMFSKNAVEKLRELFNTLFQTKAEMSDNLYKSLPEHLQDAIKPYLGDGKENK